MKKVIAIAAVIAGLTYSSSAQGLVNFANNSGAGSKISTNSVVGGGQNGLATIYSGTDLYYYALFSSASATTVNGSSSAIVGNTGATYVFNDSNWAFDGYATNGATRAGQVVGAASLVLPSSGVGSIAGGAAGQFVIVGWSANIGTTWNSVQSYLANVTSTGWVGESVVSGAITTGNGAGVSTPLIMGSASPFVTGFVLGEVVTSAPEPGTMALAALGGASLLLFRRRNK